MLTFLGALRRGIERVGAVMNAAGGWLFVVAAFFITFDVLGRKLFSVSSQATVEVTGYMLAFGIAWGLTDALTTRAHIRVDVLVMRLPLGIRVWMHALALAFLVTLNFFLAWRCWAVVGDSWLFGARDSSALNTPLIVPQGLWALGISVFFVLSVATFVEVLLLLLAGERARVDRSLGPKSLEEETAEALEAAGMGHHP